ncbi:smr domain-containing protein C11H11.03c [Biomphalaria pfeifferi]|uniref:Smr domain-containing protein C11H11.03c n=1 Tax=Biomphalaria pfeifferi TaxID=112525 RepID=A0AAD8B2V9_BIOPF|nr:smr domain-containing protein C11H11.03c [Biomphalaria pfeifferi]
MEMWMFDLLFVFSFICCVVLCDIQSRIHNWKVKELHANRWRQETNQKLCQFRRSLTEQNLRLQQVARQQQKLRMIRHHDRVQVMAEITSLKASTQAQIKVTEEQLSRQRSDQERLHNELSDQMSLNQQSFHQLQQENQNLEKRIKEQGNLLREISRAQIYQQETFQKQILEQKEAEEQRLDLQQRENEKIEKQMEDQYMVFQKNLDEHKLDHENTKQEQNLVIKHTHSELKKIKSQLVDQLSQNISLRQKVMNEKSEQDQRNKNLLEQHKLDLHTLEQKLLNQQELNMNMLKQQILEQKSLQKTQFDQQKLDQQRLEQQILDVQKSIEQKLAMKRLNQLKYFLIEHIKDDDDSLGNDDKVQISVSESLCRCHSMNSCSDSASEKDRDTKDTPFGPKFKDLHGLSVNEAIFQCDRFLYKKIEEYHDSNFRKADRFAKIITGRGNHSENSVPKIKPSVEKYLEKNNYNYKWKSNGGMVEVNLLSKRRFGTEV